MDFCGGSNERVPGLHRAAQGFTPGHKPPARIRYLKVNRKDSSLKARAQLLPQPSIETVASSADREAFNAVAQFSDGHYTKKDSVLLYFSQPGEHACIWPRFHWFGYDICVQQKIHSSILRKRTGRRLSFSPEPRRGDATRNSAKLPFRSAFRSHSSAATITAVVRPCLVIFCGPSDFALSINSLNFAFASATVHLCVLIAQFPQAR